MAGLGNEKWFKTADGKITKDVYSSQKSEYDAFVEKYAGTSIYDQLKNNPYMTYQPYQESNIWKRLIGDHSGEYDFYNGRYTQGMEYANQLVDALRQQDYNSPASAAARESAAGLNSDLTGVGTGEQPAADGSPAPAGPPAPQSDPNGGLGDIMSGFANIGMSFCSGILGLVNQFNELGLSLATKASYQIGLAKQAEDYILNYETGRQTEQDLKNGYTVESLSQAIADGSDSVIKPAVKAADYEVPSQIKGRYARRVAKAAAGNVLYDKDGNYTSRFNQLRLDALKNLSGSRVEAVHNMSDLGYSEEVIQYCTDFSLAYQPWLNKFYEFDAKVRQAHFEVLQAQQRNLNAQTPGIQAESDYKADLYGATDENGNTLGKSDAMVRFFENRARKLESEWKSLQQGLWLDLSKWILSKKNDPVGRLGVMVLPAWMNQINQGSIPVLSSIADIGRIAGSLALKL